MRFAAPHIVTVDGRRLAYEQVAPPQPAGTVLLLCGIGAKRRLSAPTAGLYRAPPSKTGLLLLNGLLAKRGVRQARRRR